MRRSFWTLVGILITGALLGAYELAAKNGPQGGAQEPPAGFAH